MGYAPRLFFLQKGQTFVWIEYMDEPDASTSSPSVKAKLKAKKTVSWPAGSDEDGDSDELIEEILDAGERGDEQPIVMQGWMEKKGGYKRRNWKRFVRPF